MMKQSLRFFPLIGFILYLHGCIFVRRGSLTSGRDGSFNHALTSSQLDQLAWLRFRQWFVVFPEGTRLALGKPELPQLLERSLAYCKQNDLPPLKHLLAPRAKGLELVVRHLGPALDAFYDVTLVYVPGDGSWRPSGSASEATSGSVSGNGSDSDTVNGSDASDQIRTLAARPPPPNTFTWFHRPVDLHVHIARLPLPREESRDHAALQRWLHERFVHKDRLLQRFFEKGSFAEDDEARVLSRVPWRTTVPATLFLLLLDVLMLAGPELLPAVLLWSRVVYFSSAAFGILFGLVFMTFAV